MTVAPDETASDRTILATRPNLQQKKVKPTQEAVFGNNGGNRYARKFSKEGLVIL
jgi:hypothetical protein